MIKLKGNPMGEKTQYNYYYLMNPPGDDQSLRLHPDYWKETRRISGKNAGKKLSDEEIENIRAADMRGDIVVKVFGS